MALNVFMMAIVVLAVLGVLIGGFWVCLKWAIDRFSAMIDRHIPCIHTFRWIDDISAEITLTDGTVLIGASGVWKDGDHYVADLGLRIALRQRYEKELLIKVNSD